MATISSLGVGSGLDAESIVTKLMALERQPLTQVEKKETGVNAKISAYGTLSGLLDTLRTASNTLGTPNSLSAFSATSSDIETLKSTASSTASAGTYTINSVQLAKAHKIYQTVSGDSSTVVNATGTDQTFSLQVAGSTSPTVLTLAAGASLGTLRDAINASSSGVSANIITDAFTSQSRLILTAQETGKAITTSWSHTPSSATIAGDSATVVNSTGSGQTFTFQASGAGSPTALTVPDGTTLDGLKTLINNAAAGVSANIVTDTNTSTSRLVLTPTTTGETVSASTSLGGFSSFQTHSGFNNFANIQAASSAVVNIDGLNITSTSNTITSAIKGVSLELVKDSATATTLTVARDRTAAKTAVDTFVTAYNALNTKIASLTAYDSTNKTGSTLTGDTLTRTIQRQLTDVFFKIPGTKTGSYENLAELGISMGAKGNLSVDASKFQTAVDSDFASVSDVLDRFGSELHTKIGKFTSSDGVLSGKTQSLSSLLKTYTQQKESLELRLDAIEKRYRTQFTALDTLMGKMQTTSSYLTQQLANL